MKSVIRPVSRLVFFLGILLNTEPKAFADVGAIAEETASALVEQLIGQSAPQADVAAAVASAKQEG